MLAYVYQVEGYAPGGPALREREHVRRRFAALLAEVLVSARLAAHDIDGLRDLHRPLVDLVTLVARTWGTPA
jgi:hypothetical protein